MRETLQQAATKLLTEAAESEHTISVYTNDGLTGLPPGPPQRGGRVRHTDVLVKDESRADGKTRRVVVSKAKSAVIASTPWR